MLDIFRKEPLGGVLWMGTARDEEEVRTIFKKLRAVSTGVYFHVRPEHGNQARHQARRVRRGRSALTSPPFWALSLLNDLNLRTRAPTESTNRSVLTTN